MFKKSLTVLVAALTLTGATFTTTHSAQAEGLGKLVAIGVVGAAVGAIAGAVSARSSENEARGFRSQERFEERGPRSGGFRQVRGFDGGCGTRKIPVYDENGNPAGFQRVSAC